MASCKECIHKTVCAVYNDSLRETLERGGTMLCQCGEYLPAADVVEVMHGYNASHMHPVDEFVCSVCGFSCTDYAQIKYDEDYEFTYVSECEFKFCPNCGAKMDGEREVDNG